MSPVPVVMVGVIQRIAVNVEETESGFRVPWSMSSVSAMAAARSYSQRVADTALRTKHRLEEMEGGVAHEVEMIKANVLPEPLQERWRPRHRILVTARSRHRRCGSDSARLSGSVKQ